PDSGSMIATGTFQDSSGSQGRFSISANLRAGDFSGTIRLSVGDQSFEAPLIPARSYLENGKCYFRAESGRARAELGGPCDSASIRGRFETFLPGDGVRTGAMEGQILLARGPAPASAGGVLPGAKLTCAYQNRRIGVGVGQATEYSLSFSNMVSLTLNPAGTYVAGKSSGRFARDGARIRLTSGPWAGAVGTLERDRSGRPAVVFHSEENRRSSGAHIVDPYKTRCTEAR
ncbi:MAG: hypothetical protein ACREB5_12115, partial [Sphingomonadaceae bacterium]